MSNPGIPFTVLAFLLVIGPLIFIVSTGLAIGSRAAMSLSTRSVSGSPAKWADSAPLSVPLLR